MDLSRDFEELFASLNAHGVRYLVVGAHALAHYASPRFTQDMDVWIPPILNDRDTVRRAMKKIGMPAHLMTDRDLSNPDMIFQFGVPPLRIDILMGVSGLDPNDAWKHRRATRYGRQKIWVLGRTDLVRNKRASGRPKDLRDLDLLGVGTRQPKRRQRRKR
jgi:hypothetical protein